MLRPVRAEGAKPPFFLIHGVHGVMPIARTLERALDRDQPLYVLHARGIDGAEPPHERMEDMLGSYLAEIRAARPRGPYVVGGMCAGGLVAMELARELASAGAQVGTVILVDPPLVPFYQFNENRTLNPKEDLGIYQQLHDNAEGIFRTFAQRFDDLPFDVTDPAQLARAIEVGIAMMVLFGRYVPPRFDGPTEFIISAERAFGHFHPQGPWKDIVAKPGRFHVVPGNHDDLFYGHLDEVLGLVRFALNSSLPP